MIAGCSRLDALVVLVADHHGLALLPDGRVGAAEARVAARADGRRAGRRGATAGGGRGVGLLRVRGDRLEVASLRNAWTQIDESLRAGHTFAAWCQQVTLTG